MKNFKFSSSANGKVFRNGLYSTAILAAAIVLAVLINLLVGAIPKKYTEFDLSAAKMYTLGDSSRQLMQSLRPAARMPLSPSCWITTPTRAVTSTGSRRTRRFTRPLQRSTAQRMHPPAV